VIIRVDPWQQLKSMLNIPEDQSMVLKESSTSWPVTKLKGSEFYKLCTKYYGAKFDFA